MKLYRIALASVLVLASAQPASALGKSPPPEAKQPAQAAPAAPVPHQTGAAPPAGQPVSGVIAVQDIPLEIDRLMTVLRALEERVAPTGTTREIEAKLPAVVQRIADAQLETKGQLGASSSMTVLTNLADLWLGIQGDGKAWADRVRVRGAGVGGSSISWRLWQTPGRARGTRRAARKRQPPCSSAPTRRSTRSPRRKASPRPAEPRS